MTGERDVTVFLDPPSAHFDHDRLFDLRRAQRNRDNNLMTYARVREWFGRRGIRVHTADYLLRGEHLSARNIYISLGLRERYRALAPRRDVTLSALFAFECPVVEPDLYRELTRAQRYFKRLYSFSNAEALRP